MYNSDTIAAIATGMTNSGIGIIRISGSESFAVAERIFSPANKNIKIHFLFESVFFDFNGKI